MNRGLQFFMPTNDEWHEYNTKILNKNAELNPNDANLSGVYVLANTMPAFVLNLMRPNLNWCIDTGLLKKHETKINVGSSYFVMDRCILGPRVCCWNAAVDRRACAYIESFAKEVANGLRWILQIYRTTNIMQQHDLFNTDLAVAKNIRNKLAFGNYTPIRLVAPLKDDGTNCEEVPMSTNDESPFFVQSFGYCSGSSAPIGGTGQFTRPHLGTAPVTGFCSATDVSGLAVKDPYVLNADDERKLNEMIARNRESAANKSYGIFKPSSGLSNTRVSSDNGSKSVTTNIPVVSATSVNFQHGESMPSLRNDLHVPSNPNTPISVPQPPHPSTVGENYIEDSIREFMGDMGGM